MCLFTTYLNFLRNHTALGYRPPEQLDCLKKTHNMPNKWNILLVEALDSYIFFITYLTLPLTCFYSIMIRKVFHFFYMEKCGTMNGKEEVL